MAADITEHKAAEQALRAKMTELETVLEAVPAIVWIAEDPECQRITGSRAAHRVLRLPADANLSLTAREPEKPQHFRVLHDGIEISPEDLPVQRAARGIEVQDFEADIVFDDGTVRHLIGNATPLRDAAGGIHGAVGAFIDITERKAAEKQLRLLVAELSHRVKNVLAVVQALAAQTLSRPQPLPGSVWHRLPGAFAGARARPRTDPPEGLGRCRSA